MYVGLMFQRKSVKRGEIKLSAKTALGEAMVKQLASLVKIAKDKLQTQERLLSKNQAAILLKKAEIERINVDISSVEIPRGGSFNAYQAQKDAIKAYLYQIEEIRYQIKILLQEQDEIRKNIRLANIEHERMLYIYNTEKKKIQSQMTKNENLHIDEVTSMLHANKKYK